MALNSLFTGLSGIKAHQEGTNVVADNIANINTTGFKYRRASFQDQLAQTLREATGPGGLISGTNPVQSGTGVKLKSIDTNFSQGGIQNTGRSTDIGIEGDGFFILSDGVNRFFTRDGAFAFDSLGQLINPANGMVVQGNLANNGGGFGATTGLENIQLDLNQEIPGIATGRVNLSGNIDPGVIGSLTTSTKFVTASTIAGGGAVNLATAQRFEARITTSDGMTSGILTVPAANYQTVGELVDGINAAIAGNDRLAGKIVAQESAGALQLRTTFGGTGVLLNLADVDAGALASLGLGAAGGASIIGGATTALNDLAQVGSDLSVGDVLRFSGTRSDGSTYEGTFTVAAGSTIADLTAVVATAFGSNVTGGVDLTGKLQLTDSSGTTVSGFTINITLQDVAPGSGLIGSQGLSTHKISTTIFDSQGRKHTLNITLAKTPVSNKWAWNLKIDNQIPTTGGSGSAFFDEDGTIRAFTPTEGEGTLLQFTPDGDVQALKIDLTGLANSDRGINGLTQFAAPSTADVVDQNGRSSGRLDNLFIRTDGVMEGRFTNGETLNLARINLANFENPGGLRRLGGNLFSETENTGNALIEIATKTFGSQIVAESLELSNVDLAQEFTSLITFQRGFQANARVITTTDQILAETVNLKQ